MRPLLSERPLSALLRDAIGWLGDLAPHHSERAADVAPVIAELRERALLLCGMVLAAEQLPHGAFRTGITETLATIGEVRS